MKQKSIIALLVVFFLWFIPCFSYFEDKACWTYDNWETVARAKKQIANLSLTIDWQYRILLEAEGQAASYNAQVYRCWINLWLKNKEMWEYEDAIKCFNKAANWRAPDVELQAYLSTTYQSMWLVALEKQQYQQAVEYLEKANSYVKDNATMMYNLGVAQYYVWDLESALANLKKSYAKATDSELISRCKWYIDYIERFLKEKEEQKLSVTNDFFSYRTAPYLQMHNIVDAWEQVTWNEVKEVIVAVIDDWILQSHPDLFSNIRTNNLEKNWDWIDNDKNWFKDDYNWWNFVYNNNSLMPFWSHWTMVAWIIWAIRNNEKAIAWIAKNVKLMPVWACNASWCEDDDIIAWINYAIDNWANIINISLWWTQFNYNKDYDSAIKRAYNHWVIVVIAAWNWDILTDETYWLNTSTTPQSPVCNYWDNKKMIIWVWALNESWEKATWSNYWDCVQFWALWEDVFTTIIPTRSETELDEFTKQMFNFWDGTCDYWAWTSFSTPIIAWIIALGYNKYWYIHPDIVWDSLKQSMWEWFIVDANKYLEILWNTKDKDKEVETNFSYKFSEFMYKTKKRRRIFIDWFRKNKTVVDSLKESN